MKWLFILVAFSFLSDVLLAQQKQIDSLLKIVALDKNDTSKVNHLCAVAKQVYSNRGRDSAELQAAILSAKQAIELSNQLNYHQGHANSYLHLGNIYFKMEDYIKSFEAFQNALKVSEKNELNHLTATLSNKIGYIHNNIMNNPSKAKGYFEKALTLFKKENNQVYIGKTLVNLSNVYSHLDENKKALQNNFEAYKLFSAVGDSSSMAIATGNLAENYIKEKQYDKAVKFIKLSKTIHERTGSKLGVAYNDLRLGTVFYYLEDYKNAENYLVTTYKFAEQIGNYALITSVTEMLYKLYKTTKKADKALYFQNRYFMSKDSINNTEKLARMSEIENSRALEKLEAENKLEIELAKVKSDEEKRQQKILLFATILILVISAVFSVFIYKRFKISKEQNLIIQNQKHEVELKNELIEEKQKEILDSIHYAKRIQTTLLAHREFINQHLKENFVLFRPKDIVSGDFYWATKKNDLFFFACCDSTGHGVPGAFMSLLSITFLNEAINERNILQPNEVFNYVRKKLVESLSRDGQKDGFDGILICYDAQTKKMTYVAANNNPVVVSDNSFEELPADRMPVGHGIKEGPFTLHEINLKPNQILYLYTDGFADQFGGPKGKKFMYKRLNELLISIANKNMSEQEHALNSAFDEWKGNLEQIDDVCIFALKI